MGVRSDSELCGLMCSKLEGLGRTTVEFMLSGKPVIGADTGGSLEVIEDGKNGLFYKQGYVNDLADKMKFLLENHESVFDMGKYACEYEKNKFSVSKYTYNILKQYESILYKGDIQQ